MYANTDWRNGADIAGLMKKRADAASSAAPQSPEDTDLAERLTSVANGDVPTSNAFDGAKATASGQRAAPPAVAPTTGLAKRTSVNGIYAVQGPDGSTTFTDVPGGSFQQVGGGGGSPDARRTLGGRLVGEEGTGSGNFSAAGATAGGGLRYVRPDGAGVVDEGTRQGFQPGSPQWMKANASVEQRQGESEADFGARVAASKQAGLNYRTHSGEFALPAVPTDPAVIGADAAYGRTPTGGGGGAGVGAGAVPGLPYGMGLDNLKKATDIQSEGTHTAIDVGKASAEQQKQARDFDQAKYEEHLKALEANKDLSPEERMRAAAIYTHNDLVQKFPDADTSAFTNSNAGRQYLADELNHRTRGPGELPTNGTADLADFTVRTPGYFTRNAGSMNPFSWLGMADAKHPTEIVRGLKYKSDGSAAPDDNAATSAGTVFTRQTPLGRELFGENGQLAGRFAPALIRAQRARAAALQKKAQQ